METSTRFRRSPEDDKPLGELVQDLSRQTSTLIRQEMRLAQAGPPKPEQTLERVQRDVATVKERAKS